MACISAGGTDGALMRRTPADARGNRKRVRRNAAFKRLLSQTRRRSSARRCSPGKFEDMITRCAPVAFYSFERAVHTERKNASSPRSASAKSGVSVQDESLGPAIEISRASESFWMLHPALHPFAVLV